MSLNISVIIKTFRHRAILKLFKFFLIGTLFSVLFFPAAILAEDVTSTNYTIFGNSVNSGGTRSTSTNFVLESTLGELSGVTTSTNFSSRSGFQAKTAESKITMALSTNAINLGTLNTGAVSSSALTITITTNAPSGYSVRMTEDGNLRSGSNDISDVSDGTVTAGSEEYGIRTSGTSGQFNSTDTAISGTLILASKSTFVSAEDTTITFKAAVDSLTFSASYSHIVTFTAVANF